MKKVKLLFFHRRHFSTIYVVSIYICVHGYIAMEATNYSTCLKIRGKLQFTI